MKTAPSSLLHASSSLSVRLRSCQTFRLVRSQPPLHSVRSPRFNIFCLVLHSPVVLTGLFPGGFNPSCLSFPEVCPAMVVCCISPLFTGRFPVLAVLLCSLGRFPVFPFSLRCSRRAPTVRLGGVVQVEMLCVSATLVTRSCFLECGIWRIIVCFSPLYPMVGCPVQLLLFECLRLCVNECPLLFGMRFVRAMPTLSVTVVIACETAAFFVCTLNQDVPRASVIWLCPRSFLKSVMHSCCILRMSASFSAFSVLSR